MGILNTPVNNINLYKTSYDENGPDTITHSRLLENALKQLNEELMAIAWYPKRWCCWFMSEDEKKEIDPMSIEKLHWQKCALAVHTMKILKHLFEECISTIPPLGVSGHYGVLGKFRLKIIHKNSKKNSVLTSEDLKNELSMNKSNYLLCRICNR